MRIEAQSKRIQDAFRFGANMTGKFAFPLLSHKRESDMDGKHQEWTRKKHNVLAGLAFLVDLGFNYGAIMLAFFEHNCQAASMVKIAHVIGADSLPEPLVNLTKKFTNKLRSH